MPELPGFRFCLSISMSIGMVWMTNGKNALLQCLWSQTLHNCTSQAETVFHLTLYTSAVCRVCDGLVMLSCVLGKPHPAGSCARLGAGEGKWALRCCSGADLLLCWRKPPVTIVLGPSVGFFSRQAVLCTFLLRCILCVPLPRDAPSEPGLPRSRTKSCSLVRLPLRETSLLPGSAVLQCFPLGSEVGRGTGWSLQSEADSPRQGAEQHDDVSLRQDAQHSMQGRMAAAPRVRLVPMGKGLLVSVCTHLK